MAERQSHLFDEVHNLRRASDAGPPIDPDALERAKYNDSIVGQIAKSKPFEYTTLVIIMFNACFIGYDADFSARNHKPENLYDCADVSPDACYQFIIFENLFAVYFTAEVLIRFIAYKKKSDCLTDSWFMFDSVLVAFMVIETWILPVVGASGPLAQLSVLRLLRLLRITRMAKLMRFFPELQIIVKGMVAAIRSVVCTAILLILILYVWAILFTSEYHQGTVADDELEEWSGEFLFGSLGKSMRHLFIMGTILDDMTLCTNSIRSSGSGDVMLIAFIVFVLISSFTMLNMLIGILCEVVNAIGEGERSKNVETKVTEAITDLFDSMDKNKDGQICREEFLCMKGDKNVLSALKSLDVKPRHFDMYIELMFNKGDESQTISYKNVIDMIMRLRPGTTVSALDFASFQTTVRKTHLCIFNQITQIKKMASTLVEDEAPLPKKQPGRRASSKQKHLEGESTARELLLQEPEIPVQPDPEIAAAAFPQLDNLNDQELLAELEYRLFSASNNGNTAAGESFAMQLPGNPASAWSEADHYRC